MTVVRAALTETRNAFVDMPATVDELDRLAGRLDEIRDANVAHNAELIADAAALGARVVCLGELCTAPYFALESDPLWFGLAEDAAEGPTVQALGPVAREHGVVLVVPLYEQEPRSGRRFNTAVVLDETGAVLGKYRKMHIPDGANECASFHETFYYDRGDREPGFPVFETSVGRVGVAICYDRHFAGSIRTLARNGAQIVFSPAVTFGTTARRMWDLEFPVDAARNRVYVGGSNRRGAEPPWNVEYFGASYFCGPQGRLSPLASRPELVVADLDLDALAEDDCGWRLAEDERPDAYA